MKRNKEKVVDEPPFVRIARPNGRPLQLRFTDPITKRDVRISTGSYDEKEAQRQLKELEAKLLLGIQTQPKSEAEAGPDMPWEAFRDRYTTEHLAHQRESAALNAESRLDIAFKIVQPQCLKDMATATALVKLKNELLSGASSPKNRSRSIHTVRGYMKSILAALNWAYDRHWLDTKPRTEKFGRIKQRAMKGRPLTEAEFVTLKESTPHVVGLNAATSWLFLLDGLWESGFRLGEIMRFSWDDKQAIHPIWPAKGYPYVVIPGDAQKNGNDETIPMLPGLKKLLGKIPEEQRTGWIFNPTTVIDPRVRKINHSRPETDWVSRVIAKIGFHANVLVRGSEKDRVAFLAWKNQTAEVRKAAPYSGPTVKFASAHDLRRSLAERLREEDVSPLIITRVLRHSSWEVTSRFYAPGEVQREALELHKQLEK